MNSAFSTTDLTKVYQMGDEQVVALNKISIEVPQGDYLAIMGPSGSGKSTLLNLLGCLDQPTGGSYELAGHSVGNFDDDELSKLRAQQIGFIFQSYNLIPYLDVLENISLPASYDSTSKLDANKAQQMAELVGLGDRLNHKPLQLSGGQQQRVGIARSLANDPAFILADEPTGNLDSKTTEEILDLLDDLNQQGKTIVLVTHEEEVAARARRIIRMNDGEITSDERSKEPVVPNLSTRVKASPQNASSPWSNSLTNLTKSALQSMVTHPLRSILTGLGVFIGVVSVIWLLAIGEGIAEQAELEIMELGANNLILSSQKPSQQDRSQKGDFFISWGLTENDYRKIIDTVPSISAAYPTRELSRRYASTEHDKKKVEFLGCLPNYRDLHNLQVSRGRFISEEDNRDKAEVCVLASGLAKKLFPFGDSLGRTVNIEGNLFTVIGEVAPRSALKDDGKLGFKELFNDNIYLPLETHWDKIFDFYYKGYDGSHLISKLTLTIGDQTKLFSVAQMIRDMLIRDHGIEDFQVTVPFELMQQAERAKMTFVALMGLVAGISLFVGGVGIMNIMLATVTERTREIGIRRAIGANKRDIVFQFLVETTVLTGAGGLAGIFAGLLCAPAYNSLLAMIEDIAPTLYESLPTAMQNMNPVVVPWSLPLVFGIAVTTGIIFGLYPARKASRMDPVEALRHAA
ncbi:MAG: ATP-binding cassette domain-containing protein [Verrucomicrobia bacterium]|nr:ATP-binding cassette domain-containing protein [Verrucomicrobiota bacterium]MDA1078560.1 ATP-binding cassette domain-containing protein [Verrucomicrobiota bacterium]